MSDRSDYVAQHGIVRWILTLWQPERQLFFLLPLRFRGIGMAWMALSRILECFVSCPLLFHWFVDLIGFVEQAASCCSFLVVLARLWNIIYRPKLTLSKNVPHSGWKTLLLTTLKFESHFTSGWLLVVSLWWRCGESILSAPLDALFVHLAIVFLHLLRVLAWCTYIFGRRNIGARTLLIFYRWQVVRPAPMTGY